MSRAVGVPNVVRPLHVEDDLSWMRDAACARLSPVESDALFFGDKWADRLAGLRLCNKQCPVRAECLDAANAREGGSADRSTMAGTWGGLTVNQRVELRKAARQ